jgi:hypothetical protein
MDKFKIRLIKLHYGQRSTSYAHRVWTTLNLQVGKKYAISYNNSEKEKAIEIYENGNKVKAIVPCTYHACEKM